MNFLLQICHNQSLPVSVQCVLTAGGIQYDSAAGRKRREKQMNLRVVAKGLKMSYTFDRSYNGFLV